MRHPRRAKRKEKQQDKVAKRAERKRLGPDAPGDDMEDLGDGQNLGPIDYGLADVSAALLPDKTTI